MKYAWIAFIIFLGMILSAESSDQPYGSDIGALVHQIPLSGPNRAAKYYLAYQDSIRVLKTKKKSNILSPNVVFAYKNLLVALDGIHWDRGATVKVEEFYNKFHENLYLLVAVSIDDRPVSGMVDRYHCFQRGSCNAICAFTTVEHDRARILAMLLAPGIEEKFKEKSPALQAYYYRNILKHLAIPEMYVPNWKTDIRMPPPAIRKTKLGEKIVRRYSAKGKDVPTDSVRLEQAWQSLCDLSESQEDNAEVQTAWREAKQFYDEAKKVPERPLPSIPVCHSQKEMADIPDAGSCLNCGHAPWLPSTIRTAEKLAEQRKQGKKPNVAGYQHLRAYLEEKMAAVKKRKEAWDEDDTYIQRVLCAAYPEQPDRIGRQFKQTNPAKRPPYTVKKENDICRVHISADRFYRRITLDLPPEVIPSAEGYDILENGLLYHCEKDGEAVRLIFCYLPAGEYDITFCMKK